MNHLLSATIALAALAAAGGANAANVHLTLFGVEPRGGELLAALQTRDQFMRPMGAAGAMAPGDRAGRVVLTIPNVPPGEYALSVLHDADSNRTMSRRPDNSILEGWAMVSPVPITGVPNFDVVKITVGEGDISLNAVMHYPHP